MKKTFILAAAILAAGVIISLPGWASLAYDVYLIEFTEEETETDWFTETKGARNVY